MAIFVFFINPDGPHPGQIKKNPCKGEIIFFSGFMTKKGQKRHVTGQHGSYVFLFHFVPFYIPDIVYLGGFMGKISVQNVKFSAFFYTTR